MRLLSLYFVFIIMVLCPRCRKDLPGTDARGLSIHQAGPSCKKKSGGLANVLKQKALLRKPKKVQILGLLPDSTSTSHPRMTNSEAESNVRPGSIPHFYVQSPN
jgi:hypothetical protein